MDETQVTERTSLASRVRAGVALLDAERPRWWEDVNVGTLRMNDTCNCVLGQLYQDFHEASDRFWGNSDIDAPSRFGFDVAPHGGYHSDEFATLERLWSFVIRQRQRWVPVNASTRYLLVPDEARHLFALRPGGVVEHFDLCHGVWHPAPAEVLKDIAETFGDMTEVAYSDLPAVAQ